MSERYADLLSQRNKYRDTNSMLIALLIVAVVLTFTALYHSFRALERSAELRSIATDAIKRVPNEIDTEDLDDRLWEATGR